ncbi:hypothetical protein [Henriciella sp.]|nr:hypothetical protein [Henriciella sp.]
MTWRAFARPKVRVRYDDLSYDQRHFTPALVARAHAALHKP